MDYDALDYSEAKQMLKEAEGGWLEALSQGASDLGDWAGKSYAQDPSMWRIGGLAAGGAALGGLSASFQPKKRRNTLGRMLTGGLLGAGAGVGWNMMADDTAAKQEEEEGIDEELTSAHIKVETAVEGKKKGEWERWKDWVGSFFGRRAEVQVPDYSGEPDEDGNYPMKPASIEPAGNLESLNGLGSYSDKDMTPFTLHGLETNWAPPLAGALAAGVNTAGQVAKWQLGTGYSQKNIAGETVRVLDTKGKTGNSDDMNKAIDTAADKRVTEKHDAAVRRARRFSLLPVPRKPDVTIKGVDYKTVLQQDAKPWSRNNHQKTALKNMKIDRRITVRGTAKKMGISGLLGIAVDHILRQGEDRLGTVDGQTRGDIAMESARLEGLRQVMLLQQQKRQLRGDN